jgi:hypothetical protein
MQTSNEASSSIDRKFSVINVPSKGEYYKDKKSYFLVRHLSFIEENILSDPALMNTEEGLKLALRSLMIDDDFDIEDLLPGDVQAISMYLYSTAFGDKLEINVKCPYCQFEEDKVALISEFKMKEVKAASDPECILPMTKKTFHVRIPTFFEEFRFRKVSDDNVGHLSKIIFLLDEIDGETNKDVIHDIVCSLPIRDSRFIKKYLDEHTPGVDTKLLHRCTSCNDEYHTHFTSGHNFLSLPESYAATLLEEMYLVSKHGQSITWESAKHMSTSQRKWAINRINQDIKKKNEMDSADASKARTKTRSFKR